MFGRRALVRGARSSVRRRRLRSAGSASRAHKFSPEGLAKVSDYIRNEIAPARFPGAILLLQQHGKPVYYENFGVRDVATEMPMSADTIFRLYSMSKPITSVVAMMLVEEGKLALDDPVSKYIPAFADMKVGVEKKAEDGKVALALEPLDRPITIKDLLRHTSGLPYGYLWRRRGAQALCRRRSLRRRFHQRRTSSRRSPRCRWPSSPARSGTTAIPPTCSAASSR